MAARIRSILNGVLATAVDEASRNDLSSGDVVTVQALDAATTYSWAITFAPEGSMATFSGSTSDPTPGTFTVDEEGAYLIRLVVDAGLGTEDTQYVRLRYLTEFGGLTLVAAGERRDGTGTIPVDVDVEGWANEQNANIQTLKEFIKPLVSSGQLLYVDANDGTSNYADYSTVQAAIDYAVTQTPSASSQWVVAVRPGTYTENITFAPWVHVVGWPGNPDGQTSESVVLGGTHTVSTPLAADRVVLANLHIENNTNTSTPTLAKTGPGRIRLTRSRVVSSGSDVAQGPAIDLQGGWLTARECVVQNSSGGAAALAGYAQTGANTTSRFEQCLINGPSGAVLNSGLVTGVDATFSNCRLLCGAGVPVNTTAENTTIEKSTLTNPGGNGVSVNPSASIFAGDVTLTVRYSTVEDDIAFDTTNLSGKTTLNIGAVEYTSLSLPGGAVNAQNALPQSKSHFYDDSLSALGADNVQDAIDLLASSVAISPMVFNKNIPEVPDDSVSYRGWTPISCELISVRVRMMSVNTVGNYILSIINEATGNSVLSTATFDMNTLTDGVVQSLTLTGTSADLSFGALDGWNATLTSDDPGFDGTDIYIELTFNPATGGGPVVEDLATTLLIGNTTGGSDIEVTSGDVVQFGDSPAAAVAPASTGRIRYNQSTTSFQKSVDGGGWNDFGGDGGSPFVLKNVPNLPNNTYRFEGWAPIDATVTDISVYMATVNTQGNYTAVFTNETTGFSMLVGANFDMNTLVAGTVTSLPLTGTASDLTFSAGDQWSAEFISDDLSFDGDGTYFSILFGTASTIIIPAGPDDNDQFEMTVSPANTINTYWFAPYNVEIAQINVYSHTGMTTSGVYTLSVTDIDNSNNILATATFDMTTATLPAATLTPLTLNGTLTNLLLLKGTRVRFQLVSDNGDLTGSGVYVQIIYRSQ